MNLQHSLSLDLVVHSERLMFVHLAMVSCYFYSCHPLVRLASIFLSSMVFITNDSQICPFISSWRDGCILFNRPDVRMCVKMTYNHVTAVPQKPEILKGRAAEGGAGEWKMARKVGGSKSKWTSSMTRRLDKRNRSMNTSGHFDQSLSTHKSGDRGICDILGH